MEKLKTLSKDAVAIAARSSILSRVAKHITNNDPRQRTSYARLKQRFIERDSPTMRREIVRRFELIDKNVTMGTTPTDGLFLAGMLLNTTADGPIVECGCFAGGSSAKLSILAKLTGRKLYVCDSFEGLPAADNTGDFNLGRGNSSLNWTPGRFAGPIEQVRANIEKWGEIEPCSFVKGWFSQTLQKIDEPIAFVFADVDLPSSVRDCLVALWPRLLDCGIYATHDVSFIKALQAIHDPDLWAQWHEPQPIIFGAGFGMSSDSPHLGFMIKGSFSPEFVKSLSIF